MASILLLGTVNEADGRVDSRPVIAEVDDEGRVVGQWYRLEGFHEPHSTVPVRALLVLPSLVLRYL